MSSIGLFYGSTNGQTAVVAAQLKSMLDALLAGTAISASGKDKAVELFDVADYYLDEMLAFNRLVLGIPTWNHGQLQTDWESVFEEFDTLDLQGKTAAVFGLGDQVGYPDTFVDALFFVADKLRERGAHLVGKWPSVGYTFQSSWACEEGSFCGLVLDEENQPLLTETRLSTWAAQILREFGDL